MGTSRSELVASPNCCGAKRQLEEIRVIGPLLAQLLIEKNIYLHATPLDGFYKKI